MIKTYRYRIKDKNKKKMLDLMSRDVKFVWNVCNSASRKKWKESRQYFHKFNPYFTSIFKGSSKLLLINAQSIQAVLWQFHKDIHQSKKQLRFKGRKTLGWIPFNCQTVKFYGDSVKYKNQKFRFWNSRKIPKSAKIKMGSFSQDNLGRWFVNIVVELEDKIQKSGNDEVGIDLGFKTTATCSDGNELSLNDLKKIDKKIALNQRAKNFKRARALHFKKKNIRKDRINKFALNLVKTNSLIAIGNISGFTKGKLAKSRYNNSWSILKNCLNLKSLEYSARIVEVTEYLTTQTCNVCGSIEGPKGIKELGVRFWICSCGAGLNRDTNAAINILNRAKCLAS